MGLTTDITHFLHIICHHPRVLGHKRQAHHHQASVDNVSPGPGMQPCAHSLDTHLLSTCCMPGYKERHDPQGVDSLVNPRGEGGSHFPSVRGWWNLASHQGWWLPLLLGEAMLESCLWQSSRSSWPGQLTFPDNSCKHLAPQSSLPGVLVVWLSPSWQGCSHLSSIRREADVSVWAQSLPWSVNLQVVRALVCSPGWWWEDGVTLPASSTAGFPSGCYSFISTLWNIEFVLSSPGARCKPE